MKGKARWCRTGQMDWGSGLPWCRKVGHPGLCNLCLRLVVRRSDSKKAKSNHSAQEIQLAPRYSTLSPLSWQKPSVANVGRKFSDLSSGPDGTISCSVRQTIMTVLYSRETLLQHLTKNTSHRIKTVITSLNSRETVSPLCRNASIFGLISCRMTQTADFQVPRFSGNE